MKKKTGIVFFLLIFLLLFSFSFSFYADFGPLNMAMVYRYCLLVNMLLEAPAHKNKRIIQFTSFHVHKVSIKIHVQPTHAHFSPPPLRSGRTRRF